MRLLILAALAVPLFGGPSAAEESPARSPLSFHGFWFVAADSSSNRVTDHTRWIVRYEPSEEWGAKLSLTPRGPLRPISYAEVFWKPASKGIDQITVGRTFPPFGRIWYDYRVDQVPVILYSDIFSPLAATDTGATATGTYRRCHWYAGAYAGDPEFGNEFGPSGLIRLEYRAGKTVTIASSQRLSATPAHGADILVRRGPWTVVGELVSSKGITQELILGSYAVSPQTNLALQHEWLHTESRWTGAATQRIGGHLEVKVGFQVGEKTSGRWLGQVVVRW